MTVLLALPLAMAATAAAGMPAPSPSPWRWPVPAPHVVMCGFDPPALRWLPGRRGVDLLTPAAAPVSTAGPGVVSFAGPVGGDWVVVVRHQGGTETTYQPVRPSVRVGAVVSAGTQLGVVAVGGARSPVAVCLSPDRGPCRPGRCLHWGLRRGWDYLDPLGLLGPGRVRLLPLLSGTASGVPPPLVAGGAVSGTAVTVGAWRWVRRRRMRRFGCG